MMILLPAIRAGVKHLATLDERREEIRKEALAMAVVARTLPPGELRAWMESAEALLRDLGCAHHLEARP